MSERFRVALVGHGIGPSLSPALHVEEARQLGLDYDYEVVDLLERPELDLGSVLTGLERDGFAATNITHPFKQAVLAHVAERSEAVHRIGSANLVLFSETGRVAHNTDASGFGAALTDFLAGHHHGAHGTVVQIGAGGAGLATASALVDMGFTRLMVHDRDPAAAVALVARFEQVSTTTVESVEGDPADWLDTAEGVVHVTPTGMKEHPGVAFDISLLPPRSWLAEVVYRPLQTELVRRARARGLPVLDGGAMAVGQAVDSLRLITGRVPDRARMTAHFDKLVAHS